MPVALLRAYIAMLPRLQAEESLRALQTASYGSGWAQPDGVRAYIDALETQARGGKKRKPQYVSPADFAQAMGMTIKDVPKKG